MTTDQLRGVIRCWNLWRREHASHFNKAAMRIGAGKTLSMFEKIAIPIVHRVREVGPIDWNSVYEEVIVEINKEIEKMLYRERMQITISLSPEEADLLLAAYRGGSHAKTD